MKHYDFDHSVEVPESLLKSSGADMRVVFNKCGPGGFINRFIPNHLLGLDITDSCNIHDWTFVSAKSQKEHVESDKLFLSNMKKQIDSKTRDPLLKVLRYGLSYIYFGAVRMYSFFTKQVPQSDDRNEYK